MLLKYCCKPAIFSCTKRGDSAVPGEPRPTLSWTKLHIEVSCYRVRLPRLARTCGELAHPFGGCGGDVSSRQFLGLDL